MTCKDCAFWLAPETEGPGYCRRYPPQSFLVQNPSRPTGLTIHGHPAMTKQETQLMTNFPPTNSDIWCGEYVEVQ